MGDRLKADECPRRKDHDRQDLGEGIALRREGGRDTAEPAATDHNGDKAHCDPRKQQERANRLYPCRKAFTRGTDQARGGKDRDRQEHLAHIDGVARDLIRKAEAEDIAEQESDDQGQRRAVRPDDRCVGQQQHPRAQKAVVASEHLGSKGIRAARVGIALHQHAVAQSDDQHDDRADQQPDH